MAGGMGPARGSSAARGSDPRSAEVTPRRPPCAAHDAPSCGPQDNAVPAHADAPGLLPAWAAGARDGRSVWLAPPLPRAHRTSVLDGDAEGASTGRIRSIVEAANWRSANELPAVRRSDAHLRRSRV